jgi:hypothetical protein
MKTKHNYVKAQHYNGDRPCLPPQAYPVLAGLGTKQARKPGFLRKIILRLRHA